FYCREIDLAALQRVVEPLGYGKEIGRTLNHAPLRAQAEAVHEQGERRKRLGHAAPVEGRVEIHYPKTFERPRLLPNALDYLGLDERFVIINLGDSINRHSNQRSEEHTSELQSRGHLVC